MAGAPSDRSTPSAADGSFVFNTVLAGPFHLQACDTQVPRWCGSVRGASQPPGETVVTIAIPARGSVSGVVRRTDGSTFGGAEVWISMPDYAGPLQGSFGNFVQADAAGVYLFNGVPPGMAVVRARANYIWGLAIGVVTAGAGTVVDVQLGTATNMLNLNATLDYNYVSGYDGTTNLRRNGGLDYSHQSLRLGAAGRAASVHVSSDWSINGLELSGRQLTIARGHEDRVGVRVTRKVFAPISGGFVRYIEELSNPLPVDVAVRVRIGGVSLLNRGSIVSSSSAQHVVVTHSGWATGFVFGGASGTPQTVAAASFLPGQYEYSYDWVVTVPAGQTIRLMHFLLYGGSAADLDPVVSSLGTPTGLALEGLTAAEIASIVNFVIPPSP